MSSWVEIAFVTCQIYTTYGIEVNAILCRSNRFANPLRRRSLCFPTRVARQAPSNVSRCRIATSSQTLRSCGKAGQVGSFAVVKASLMFAQITGSHDRQSSASLPTVRRRSSFLSKPLIFRRSLIRLQPDLHMRSRICAILHLRKDATHSSQGVRCVKLSKYDFREFLRCIARYRVTAIPCVPPVAVQLARESLPDQYDLSSLKRIMVAAAPIKPETVAILRERYKVVVLQTFGCTEVSPTATALNEWDDRYVGSVGRLLPGMCALLLSCFLVVNLTKAQAM